MAITRGVFALGVFVLLTSAMVLHLACDSRPPQPTVTESESLNRTVAVPTTATRRLSLELLPFTVDASTQWKVTRYGTNPLTAKLILQGPLPEGDAHILLGLRENVSGDLLKSLIKRAEKDAPLIEQQGGTLRVRSLGQVQIIERRLMPAASDTSPATPSATAPAASAQDDPIIDWRVNLFVPMGLNYEQYELKVLDLTHGGLSKNQSVIQSIFDSLHLDETPLPPL
jgi:hypothetical protein